MGNVDIFREQDYISFLLRVFEAKKSKNKYYSLRAFARDLGLAPSRVSTVFNRKGHLSLRSAKKIADTLGMDATQHAQFLSMIQAQSRGSKKAKLESLRLVAKNNSHRIEKSPKKELVTHLDWRHFVVRFFLTSVENSLTPQEIAFSLDMPEEKTKRLIDELLSMGLIEKSEDGRFRCSDVMSVDKSKADSCIKHLHKSLLEKALMSLEHDPIDRRFFKASIFTLSKSQHTRLQSVISDILEGVSDMDESQEEPHTQICAMAVQLVSLAQMSSGAT